MKKIISLILALVMVMGLAVSASAASITIAPPTTDGTETGITYTAYKIFDATISESGAVAYTIESTSPYYNAVYTSGYFTLTPAAGSTTTYVVTANENYTAEEANTFADTLKAVTGATAAGTLTKQDNGNYKLGDLADGYYLVTSSVGSDLILETIGDATATAKNSYPSLEKKVEGKEATTADKGEDLTFTINVTIPEDAVGEIVVHDAMTNLTYKSMTPVDGITVNTVPTDNCTVEFTLSADYVSKNKSETVVITYVATVTADAIANNEAWLVDGSFTSERDSTEILTTDIVIDKVDKTSSEKLAGAKFVLKNSENQFYKVTEGVVSWVENQADATKVTTDDKGAAKFENIADGTYYLVETEAPAGYNLLTAPVTVQVTAAKNGTTVVDVTAKVENSTGSELPSTGGMGTTLFYVIGGLMMAGAAVLLVTKKRMA